MGELRLPHLGNLSSYSMPCKWQGSWSGFQVLLSTSMLHGYSDDSPSCCWVSGIKTFLFSQGSKAWEANTWGYFWVSDTMWGGRNFKVSSRDRVTISDQTGTFLALAWRPMGPSEDTSSDLGCTGTTGHLTERTLVYSSPKYTVGALV